MSRENDEDSNFKRPALVRAVVKRENEEDSIKNVHPKSKSQIVNSIRENDLPKISSTSKRENDAEQKVKIRRENEDDGIKNIHPIAKSQIINIVRENDLPKVSSAIKRENDAEQRIKIKREQEDEQDSSQIENQRENERNKNGEIKRDENENQSSEIRSLTGFSSQSRRENDEDSDEEAEQSNEMSKEIHQQLIGLEIDSQKQERERIKQQMKKVNEQELLVPLDKQRGIDIIMKQMAQENLLEVSDQVQSAQNGEPAKKILLLDNVTPGSKPSEWQLNPAVEQQAQKAHVTRDAMPEILGGLQGADIMRSEPFVIPPHYEVEDLFWDRVKLDALIVERNQLLSESWNKETTIKRLEFILNSRTRELHTLEQKMTTEKNRQKNNNLQKLEQIKTLKAKVQQNEEEKIKLAQALKQKEELDKNNESAQQPSTLSYQSIKLKQQQLLQPTAQNLNLNQPSPKQPLPKLEGHVVKQIVAYRNKSSKDLDDKEDNHLLDQKGIGQQESKKGINEKDLKKDIGKGNSPAVGPEQVTILQGNVKKKSRIELPSNQNSLKINGSNGAHTNTSEANELNAAKGKKK
ncbi:MAG: hypothetical protein EZS28_003602 [Streblomastix strix]|uniref:Uncharacterized protein n=1 Tax=Streblomastix strix TaxID=222440 RepID=A0A5J4X142_9EUKA|nr:MAG: hypothetical protein EZS28_003602 [Streblomastix strix]